MKVAEVLASTARTLTKPMAVVLYAGEYLETVAAVFEARKRLLKAGIPVYPTIEAATKAVSLLIRYYESAEKR
jgi:acyl-CoA synthetase (NDP forming)